MRLFVNCHAGPHRIYFVHHARTRQELPYPLQVICSLDNSRDVYNPWEVTAEPQIGGTVGGAVLGGLVGILAGPLGVILGGLAGGALGRGAEEQDVQNARRFNDS